MSEEVLLDDFNVISIESFRIKHYNVRASSVNPDLRDPENLLHAIISIYGTGNRNQCTHLTVAHFDRNVPKHWTLNRKSSCAPAFLSIILTPSTYDGGGGKTNKPLFTRECLIIIYHPNRTDCCRSALAKAGSWFERESERPTGQEKGNSWPNEPWIVCVRQPAALVRLLSLRCNTYIPELVCLLWDD